MTDATIYNILTALPEISFIAGTNQELDFTVYDDSGIYALNVSGATWYLNPYGKFSAADNELEVAGTSVSTNTFKILLTPANTLALSGKYIQQIEVVDNSTSEKFRAQGNILILPSVSTT